MPKFFIDAPASDQFFLSGETGRHITKSLRMRVGETLTLCDGRGTDYSGEIASISGECAQIRILSAQPSTSEPQTRIHLYQCLPKGDKFDLIVQKSVELGVCDLVPVLSSRCIASLSGKEEKKLERWNKIALEAAKQSGRGTVPQVEKSRHLTQALSSAPGLKILFYEGGGKGLREILQGDTHRDISVFVGPEGGFSAQEVDEALAAGVCTATLGPRILRTETAPLMALSIILYEKGEL